jgi:peroxiredoxin
MEVWFQAGLRADLVGEGEPVFVLQSLGVMYATQVDPTTADSGYLGGLTATRVRFESFTHTGVAVNVDDTTFGTANLVARAPSGTWTPAHDTLLEAMISSVQISPPTADAAPVGLRTGYRAPFFEGITQAGLPFTLSDYEGQLVFVHFWFVDCPYCREEWPHLQAVYKEYENQGMVVLAINGIDPPEYINDYFASARLEVPVVLDDGTLHELFNVSAFPTTFVIGPDGIIVSVARGPMSENNMRYLVEQYLD